MKLGTLGCALATTLGSLASCAVMYTTMMRRGILRLSALRQPPSMASVMPMLRAGLPLSLRNAISFGMVLYASLLCVRCGSAYQAAFEVIRQVWCVWPLGRGVLLAAASAGGFESALLVAQGAL